MGNSAQEPAGAPPPAYEDVVGSRLIVDHGDDERNHQNCTKPPESRSPAHHDGRLTGWLVKSQFRFGRTPVARVEWALLDNDPTHKATAESVRRQWRDLKRNTRELLGFDGKNLLNTFTGCLGVSSQPDILATANTGPPQPPELEYSCSHWSIHMWVYLKDLPRELEDGGILWRHEGVEVLKDKIVCNNDFVPGRKWLFVRNVVLRLSATAQAEVMVRHWDRTRLQEWDFRDMVSAERIMQCVISQRTKPGKFKRAVCFHQHFAYGNDVTGDHVESWKDEHRERFGRFISPLLPET